MKLAAFLLCLLLPLSAWPQQAPPERVLFVGNSYTYYWNLPQQVAAMAAAQGTPLAARQSVSGGVSLGLHWEGKRGLKTRELIASGQFDAIILQDYSTRPVLEPDSTLYYGKLLAEAAQNEGARIYLYLTWARENNPLMQPGLDETYSALAKATGATIIPVGPAWRLALQLRPGIQLFELDGSHPSPLGSYLSACVFFGVLTEESPLGLPNQLLTTDREGQPLYLNIVHPDDALFCQLVAAEAIRNFAKK
jgi:hypothetical protein